MARQRYGGIYDRERFAREVLGPTWGEIVEAQAACAPLEEEFFALSIAKVGLFLCARDILGQASPFAGAVPIEACERHEGYKQFLGLIDRERWIGRVLLPCRAALMRQQESCFPFGKEYQAIAAAMTGIRLCARALIGEVPMR